MTDAIRELTAAYLADERGHDDGSAWVMLNMISSVDGAISIQGLSGGLGNAADRAVFKTLRSLADVILVAAGTARAEAYGPPVVDAGAADERRRPGQAERPTIAVMTRSLKLDMESELFASSYRPTVVTVSDSPEGRRAAVAERADMMVAGTGSVDMVDAVAQLAARFGPIVLAEGGPTLNAQLAAADVLDELCLTTSPLLVGGNSGRILANGPAHEPRRFGIERAVPAGGLLFTRYLRLR
ncbi:MAG: dihydrofolate reductase family protein [Acidimicrobiales bacterium]